jgi:integrin-linked kinase-associated serine/threonine phosphatase 2C
MDKFANDCYWFAVYDGHGSSGREAASTASDDIQQFFDKKSEEIKGTPINFILGYTTDAQRINLILKAFKYAEGKLKATGIDYSNSGCCAIGVFI